MSTPSDDADKLDAMIELLEGEGGHHLVDDEEQEVIVGWLKELQGLRAKRAAELKGLVMRVLMDCTSGCHGLTQEEAERVWTKFGAHVMPEFESGPCRICEGRGKASRILSTDCWGHNVTETDRCFTCNGSGTDPKRIKVPEALISP